MIQEHTLTTFTHIVKRLSYPTGKSALVEFVRNEGTGDDVVDLARLLPEQTYERAGDVLHEIEKLKGNTYS